MKVVLFEMEPREFPVFAAMGTDHDVSHTEKPLDFEYAGAHATAEVVSTFIFSRLDRQVLEQMPALRLIATRSTGFDHIDLDYCAAHGIAVANVPSYGENTVAEHVFALLLAISHRLPEAMDRAQRGYFSPEGLQGFDLAGRTLGVIGTGRIGQHVIRIARGFQMQVLAHDAAPQARPAGAHAHRLGHLRGVLRHSLSKHVHNGGNCLGLGRPGRCPRPCRRNGCRSHDPRPAFGRAMPAPGSGLEWAPRERAAAASGPAGERRSTRKAGGALPRRGAGRGPAGQIRKGKQRCVPHGNTDAQHAAQARQPRAAGLLRRRDAPRVRPGVPLPRAGLGQGPARPPGGCTRGSA